MENQTRTTIEINRDEFNQLQRAMHKALDNAHAQAKTYAISRQSELAKIYSGEVSEIYAIYNLLLAKWNQPLPSEPESATEGQNNG